MDSFHYQLGYIAAQRSLPPETAYAGRWRAEWLDGHYDGWMALERAAEAAKVAGVLEQRQRVLAFARRCPRRNNTYTRRKSVRKPLRGVYARRRMEEIFAVHDGN